MNKKIGIICIIMFVIMISWIGHCCSVQEQKEMVYKETAVTFGDLAVGIAENGNITVGTTEQEFELDISAFSGTTNMPFTIPSVSNTTDSDTRSLIVEEVYISVGQKIEKGDAMFKLTDESVESIRTELAKDLKEATLELEKFNTEEKTIKAKAAHIYETNITYGNAAQLENQETIRDLRTMLEEATILLKEKQEALQTAQEELKILQVQYQEDKKLLEEANYLLKIIDIEEGEDLYGYVMAENSREVIEQKVEKEEEALENSELEIENIEKEITNLQTSLVEKQKDEELGCIIAKKSYDTRMISFNNADEIYNIQTQLTESDVKNATYEYEQAKKKQTDFDTYIVDGIVVASYSGVITEISIAEGDAIENQQTLMTLNDYNEVALLVDLKETEMEQVQLGDAATVFIAAYPEEYFIGQVTTIGEASLNTSTSVVTYPVEVTIRGELSGIYENMTGEVTFTTKEIEEVTQVSNRAITRENSKSYVKVKGEKGEIIKKEVQTGFSDGICVEIVEGLSEGDVVLIESRVSEE